MKRLLQLVVVSVGLAATSAQAGTWDGSTDMNWTQPDSTSWSGGTYSSGDDVAFSGAGPGTVTVTAGGVNPSNLSLSSGNYLFTGGM